MYLLEVGCVSEFDNKMAAALTPCFTLRAAGLSTGNIDSLQGQHVRYHTLRQAHRERSGTSLLCNNSMEIQQKIADAEAAACVHRARGAESHD